VKVLSLLLASGLHGPAMAQRAEEVVREIGFDQRLGAQVPLDLVFRDESGASVRLDDLVGPRPVVLTLVYYECPMLCSQVLNGLVRCLRAVDFAPGEDFDLVTVSIDPGETSGLAARKQRSYAAEYGAAGAAGSWRFLVGDESSIRALADAVGFRYLYDEASGEYAHASGFVVLTPEGRASRYFYGIEFPSRDLRLALVEASQGRIGSIVDQVLLLCFHYDPATGRYGFAILTVLRALGALTVVAIAGFALRMLLKERRAARAGGRI